MADPSDLPRPSNRASFAEIRREVKEDLRGDMAEARLEHRGWRERWRHHLAGKGPDGEGAAYAD